MNWTAATLSRAISCHAQTEGRRHGVLAVTTLDGEVFTLRSGDPQRVELYDAATFTFQRHVVIPGLGYSWGLAACAHHKCLYVSDIFGYQGDGDHSSVHRVELSGKNAVKKWPVGSSPRGLSVNKDHNVVVACLGANKIQEYTTDGTLVREISPQAGVSSPWHAVQLSTGDHVVSECRSPGMVSVVGVDGQLVRSYYCSSQKSMKRPTSVAVTRDDVVVVADSDNNRLFSINVSLGCVQELVLSDDAGIQEPLGLCLDESRGRLYVGEGSGMRQVLVFDNVKL